MTIGSVGLWVELGLGSKFLLWYGLSWVVLDRSVGGLSWVELCWVEEIRPTDNCDVPIDDRH